MESFRHKAIGHTIVSPNAAVDEFLRRGEVVGAVEDFGSHGDHSAGEADEVLHRVVQYWGRAVVLSSDQSRKEDVCLVFCHRPVEVVFFEDVSCAIVEPAVLVGAATEEEVFLWSLLVLILNYTKTESVNSPWADTHTANQPEHRQCKPCRCGSRGFWHSKSMATSQVIASSSAAYRIDP